jgi:uncharacterized protein with von Willebrand factor type A (vWA) domain
MMDLMGALSPTEAFHALGDRATRDQNQFDSRAAQASHLSREPLDR